MGFKSVLKKVVKVGNTALPIAAAFGVPGAASVLQAVNIIHADVSKPNEKAVEMVAASVDALDERIDTLEQVVLKMQAKMDFE